MEKGAVTRRSREDWTAAAVDALAEGGVAAVAVEPLAARLGATKGSAYWHFRNRDDLLRGALERWETDYTEAVIAKVDAQPDPEARLRVLFTTALRPSSGSAVDAALLASPDHPVVAPILRRVTERRLNYLTSLYADLGFAETAANHRAVLAYTTYLGTLQLRRAQPKQLPRSAPARAAYLDEVLAALMG